MLRRHPLAAGTATAAAAPASAPADAGGGLLDFLELDASELSSPELVGLRLASLGSYFASLEPRGPFSFERAFASVADRFGLAAALPLAMFLPRAWRRDKDVGGLLSSFPSLAASQFFQASGN